MSEAQAILRPTILGSLLDAAAATWPAATATSALFESAAVYRASETEPCRRAPRARRADHGRA